MRIGIVLNLTFNLPFGRIATAGLRDTGHGTGDIPLTLAGSDRIAYMHLWPHARPWRIAHPEPMLRCVPNAPRVAQVLAQAWSQAQCPAASADPAMSATTGRSRGHTDLSSATASRQATIMALPRKRWFAADRGQRLTQGA
jgi:hypothetical protein